MATASTPSAPGHESYEDRLARPLDIGGRTTDGGQSITTPPAPLARLHLEVLHAKLPTRNSSRWQLTSRVAGGERLV